MDKWEQHPLELYQHRHQNDKINNKSSQKREKEVSTTVTAEGISVTEFSLKLVEAAHAVSDYFSPVLQA